MLRKEIECILRAILYPNSNIVLICKDDDKAQKYMNDFKELIDKHKVIQSEIREINNEIQISFKNGSYIKTINRKEESNNQSIRGKKFDKFFDSIQDLFIIDEEEFENAIKPFVNERR